MRGGAVGSIRRAHRPGPRAWPRYVPPIRHVFVINIENKGYDTTWGDDSPAPYLAKKLRAKGVLLSSYYGTAHNSLGNYLAQISGQGPDPADPGRLPDLLDLRRDRDPGPGPGDRGRVRLPEERPDAAAGS